ncbi:hypothetical protein UFOVP56_1, partial [uncultured Caudovirales phage]
MASGWDLNYDQFRQAMDSVAGAGKNDWSAPDSGALALQMAGGKTWNPSGAGSGVTYHPATPAGGYQYDENGNLQQLPPGHWEADHGWHLDNPPPPTYDPENGTMVNHDVYSYYNTQPIQQAATPESWTISGDMSALLGQPGSNQHADVTYVKQGNQLVPLNAPTSWKYEPGNGFLDAVAAFAPMAMAVVAPTLAPILAGALGVSNATAAIILSAGTNVAAGQDPLKAIENAAIAYTGTAVAGQVASQLATSGVTNAALSGQLGSAAGNAVATALKGGDPLQALVSGGIGMGTSALADQIPGFSDLPAAAQKAITTTMASELQGKDPTQALMGQALNAGINAAKSYTGNLPDSFYNPATGESPVNVADLGTGNLPVEASPAETAAATGNLPVTAPLAGTQYAAADNGVVSDVGGGGGNPLQNLQPGETVAGSASSTTDGIPETRTTITGTSADGTPYTYEVVQYHDTGEYRYEYSSGDPQHPELGTTVVNSANPPPYSTEQTGSTGAATEPPAETPPADANTQAIIDAFNAAQNKPPVESSTGNLPVEIPPVELSPTQGPTGNLPVEIPPVELSPTQGPTGNLPVEIPPVELSPTQGPTGNL